MFKSVDMGEVIINLSTPTEEYIADKGLSTGTYSMFSISSSSLLLSENDLECMFDPYKIVDSTNRKNVLRAIVLSSVKNMLQALGGIIWVESQILKSTSFNVIIPEG
jgi:signal transduction histidine kinase